MKWQVFIGYMVGWRILLGFLVGIAVLFLPYTPTFHASNTLPFYGSRFLTSWAHFDGAHYLWLAEKGYVGTGLIQAFFPFFPLSIKAFALIFNPLLVGLGMSFVCVSIGMWLMRLNHKTLGLYLVFPTAFFFGAVYTESLFLCLTVIAMVAGKHRRYSVMALAGYLAGLTRLTGCLLSVWFAYNWWQKKGTIKQLALALTPLLGLITYMVYLGVTFHNPLMFLSVQKDFGAERSAGLLIPLITPLFRYSKMLITVPLWSHAYYILLQELFVTLVGFWLCVKLWRKDTGAALYCGLSLLLPTLTGTFSSMPRYVLPLFPLFIELSTLIKPKYYPLVMGLFAILQLINLILFTEGRWVA